jgi:hypothetical protein
MYKPKEEYLKDLTEVAEKDLDELFEFVNEWAEKQEANNIYVQGVLSMTLFDDKTDELLDSRYNCNMPTVEILDIHLEDIKKEIEEKNQVNDKKEIEEESQINDKKGFCNKHGAGVELLVVCKHLIEGTSRNYMEVSDGIVLCQDCLEIPPSELIDISKSICTGCFEEIKLKNGLEKIKIN